MSTAATIPELLDRRAEEEPGSPFLFFKDEVFTRRRIADASVAAAAELKEAGISAGDRAALLLPNGPEFIRYYFGALRLGAIVVPINTLLKAPEVEFIVKDSGAKVIVKAAGIEQTGAKPAGKPETGQAAIIYTSGTTGFPKGAVLTHQNYLFDVERCVRAIGMTREDRFLCFLPLFHVNGQVVTLLSPLWSGGSMVLMERFQPKEFFELLSTHKCTAFSGVPAVYGALLNVPDADRYELSSLRYCICGAAPMPVEVFEAFEKRFSAHILEGYGLSEGTCVSSVNPPPPGPRKIGSIGVPIDDQRMAILGPDGRELGPDEVGEIAVSGGNVMSGYWNNEKATAETIKDGWLHTGDLGCRDRDGYYFISGRKKEMIIRGGENIYPKEIEEALYRHPKVREAAVVGLPDKRWGEEVAAFLVLKEGEASTPKDIRSYLKDKVADYKVPRKIEFRESLPKTATGKIQKLRLRDDSIRSK